MSYQNERPIYGELNTLKAERDTLSAELERVKAERDRYLKSRGRWHALAYKKNRELKDIKSRLPVNADGEYPEIGDKQWYLYKYPESNPVELEIESIRDNGGGWEFGFTNGAWHFASYCHSSSESCRAAAEVNDEK